MSTETLCFRNKEIVSLRNALRGLEKSNLAEEYSEDLEILESIRNDLANFSKNGER